MATYNIPYQNLSYNIPDEGEVWRNPNDSWDTSVYRRMGNKIEVFNIEELGRQYLETHAKYGKNVDSAGNLISNAPTYVYTFPDGTKVTSGGRNNRVYGEIALKERGIDVNSIPKTGYNLADVFSAFGSPVSSQDISTLKSQVQSSGEVITQNISPVNPQGVSISSNLSGSLVQSPSIQQTLAAAGGTPQQISEISAATKQGQTTQLTPQMQAQLTPQQTPTTEQRTLPTGQTVNIDAQGNILNADGTIYTGTGDIPAITPTKNTTGGNAVTGNSILDALLASLQKQLDDLLTRGQAVNPYIEITPERIAEFMTQAQTEISPYYSNQLKLAKEGFLRSVGYSTEELGRYESDMEKKYGVKVRNIGESMAEKGFALSGIRQKEEQTLAAETQQDIESKRRILSFNTGTAARTFAQEWGNAGVTTPTIPGIPRILPGQTTFEKSGANTPFYELSPEVYEGLIGSKQWEQKAAQKTRTSQLESAWKESELAKRYRSLTL